MRSIRPALLFAAFTTTVACSGKDAGSADTGAAAPATAAAPSGDGSSDLADVTNYRLTMADFDKLYAAQKNVALKMKALPEAERERIKQQHDAEDVPDNETIDQLAARIGKDPIMKQGIEEAGLTTRKFALLTLSMMQTGMAAAVLDMRPKDNQDSLMREMKVNPENVKFYREHKAELEQRQKAAEAEMKKLGMSEE